MSGLPKAVAAAQISRINMIGLAIAYDLTRADFRYLLRLPGPVEKAFQQFAADTRIVAMWMAVLSDVDCPWHLMPKTLRERFIGVAHELIMDSPMEPIRHSSVGAAENLLTSPIGAFAEERTGSQRRILLSGKDF